MAKVDIEKEVGGVAPVNPSVVNNFVAFSDAVGGQKDSGYKASSFVLADGLTKITVSNVAPVAPNVGDLWVDTT